MDFPADWTEAIDAALAAEPMRSPSPAFSDIIANDPPEPLNALKNSLIPTGTTETGKNPTNMEPSTEITRGSDAFTSADLAQVFELLKKAEKNMAEDEAKAQAAQKKAAGMFEYHLPGVAHCHHSLAACRRAYRGSKVDGGNRKELKCQIIKLQAMTVRGDSFSRVAFVCLEPEAKDF